MTLTRRNLLAGAGAGALALSSGRVLAQTAEFSYKYANNLPVSHPMNLRAKEMADAIRAETKGRVDIQIFPNNQLGGDTDMLSQVRSGGIEFFTLSGLILATLAGLLEFAATAGAAKALLMVGVVYGLGQLIEGFFLTPRLVGERIGLHPLAVIFALLAFGQLLGFVGVLIALPSSAVLLVALRRAQAHYRASKLYLG